MKFSGALRLILVILSSLAAWSSVYAATPKVGAGEHHTIFLKNDGSVWSCGGNVHGELGDGTATDRNTPVQTIWLAGVSDISVGSYHTLALRGDGTVWAWGWNNSGQLGNGTQIDSHNPVQVSGLTGIVSVSGGQVHSLALKNDGTVWAWGDNYFSQLGDGTNVSRSTPVQVDGLANIIAVSGRYSHSVALKTDGTVWTWGYNYKGQLGDGTTTARPTAGQVSGVTDVAAVAAGYFHTVVLKNDGTVWSWGDNAFGQLGNGNQNSSPTPVQVNDLTNVVAIAAGAYHTLALKGDGTVWAWGKNEYGQLGDGSTADRWSPVQASGVTGVTGISASANHSVVLMTGGVCRAWGLNGNGQLGDGTTLDRHAPVLVLHWDGSMHFLSKAALAGGDRHALALQSDGTAWAGGDNSYGQLGDGTTTKRLNPVLVPNLTGLVALAGGEAHSLALKDDGTIWAWGYNGYGQLGDGTWTQRLSPVQVPNLTGLVALAGGEFHSLALKNDGTVWAWGLNGYGQLGDGTQTPRLSPVQVPNLTGVVALAGGENHSLALKYGGIIWAWGFNAFGQLGDGTTTDRFSPVQVPNLTGVVTLARGWYHVLALKNDGTVWAWGHNVYGEIGDGTTTNRSSPVQVPNLTGVVALAGGAYHSLALKNDGTVWAWGENFNGQLGDGTTANRFSPVQVPNLTGVVALAGGEFYSLALKNDGTVWAWGYNGYGQLGDGTQTQRLSPVQIKGPNGNGFLSLRLPAPKALTPTGVTENAYTAHWSTTASTSASAFKSSTDPAFNSNSLAGQSRTLSGLVAGTPHDYQVRCFINNQYTEYSSPMRFYTQPQAATISSTPASSTNQTSASLTVSGTNVTLYKYQVDGGTLSQPTSVATPITLSGLSEGTHTVTVWGGIGDSWQATPTTASWTVDTTPPTGDSYAIVGPGEITGSNNAYIKILGGGPYFRWSLDGVNWSNPLEVGTVVTFTGLGDGSHTIYFQVRDAAGNWQTSPTAYIWTVDTSPPTATVTTPPPSITNARDITLNVVAGDVTGYKYTLDGASYGAETPVGTPINLTNLPDGDHTVAIIGRDAVGNWQSGATTYPFTVDTVAPVAVISGAPNDPTNAKTATLTVSGTGVVSYQYNLDNGPWQTEVPVSISISLSNLADGTHTVSVIGRDSAGNMQSTPTSESWTVDTVAPAAVISGTPDTPTNNKNATLTVSGTSAVAYVFSLDNGTPSAETPIATPITLTNLPDGGHIVSVAVRDAAGNWQQTPTEVNWVVDTNSPTAVLSGVPAELTQSTQFTVVVSGTGVTAYRYMLDGGSFGPETLVSQAITRTDLADGSHTLSVIGRDQAGNWQETPTEVSWIIDTQAPMAVLSGTPMSPTNAKNATMAVSGTEVVAYRVALDSGDYGDVFPVATPITLTNLADGSHTVAVIGADAAGNWQKTASTTSWVVDTDSPTAVLAGVPDSPTTSKDAILIVNGTDVVTYKYTVDGVDLNTPVPVTDRIYLRNLADGSHTVTVVGADAAGNWQTTPTTASWVVDTQAPLATISGTPDTPTQIKNATLVIGGEGVTHYRYSLDGGNLGSEVSVDLSISLTNLADGSHTVAVVGRDAAGNWQQTPVTATWVVDTDSPTASITGAPPEVTNATAATLNIGGEGVTEYRFTVDGGDFGAPVPVSSSIVLSGLSDGSHTVTVIGRDLAGNWQVTPTTVSWVVDTVAPVATVSGTPPSPTNATSASLSVAGPGVVAYRAKLDSGAYGDENPVATPITLTNLSDGSHTLSVIGRDTAGNWQAVATPVSWVVDTTPPLVTITGVPTSPTSSKTATLTVGGEGVTAYKYKLNGGSWGEETDVATPISLSNLSDGQNTVSVVGRDAAGNWQHQTLPTTVSWTVDTAPPAEVTFTGQPDSLTNASGATITIGGGGVAYYKWSLDGVTWSAPVSIGMALTLSGLGDGSHTLYLLAGDAVGNWQTSPTTYTWTVDATPPAATVITPPPSITNSPEMTLNVMAGDVTVYKFALDSGPFGPETPVGTPINLTNLPDGNHTVAIIGRDSLGNWQAQGNATIYSFSVDTVAPMAVLSGAPDDPTNTTTATLTVSGVGVVSYKYKLDNGSWQSEAPVATPITLSDLDNGTHTVSVVGRDTAGNLQATATATTVTWTVDTVAPVVVIAGNPDTPTSSRDLTLDVSGTGVTFYRYKLDDGAYSDAISVATDIVLTGLADGGHRVSVIGRDAAGNWQSQASATTATWVVDTQAPIVTLAGVPDSPTNSKTATVLVAGEGVNFYRYKLDGGTYGPEFSVETPITLTGLADGSHRLSVKGRDLAGNWQQSPTETTWIVDTLVPLAILTGAPNGTTNATTATITVSGTEVTSYRYKLDNGAYGAQTPVATPITLSALADGSHTVSVLGHNDAGTWQVAPTEATWTVNTAAPTATLSGVPASPTSSASATITVGGTGVTEYQYKLDTGTWNAKTAVATPIQLANLGNGSHTLAVIGCNSLGTCQSQAVPVTATWTVDTVPPAMPTIPAAANPSRTPSCRPTLTWTSVADAAVYLVEVADNAGFNNPIVQRTVSDQVSYRLIEAERLTKKGLWFWRVRARDAAGNVSTWASTSFTFAPQGVPLILLLQSGR